MSTELPIVGLQDTVEQCMQMLNNHKTRYLLIFNDEQFEGVVTINDVLREALANKEMIFDELLIFQNPDFQDRVF
jgi:predicted transcriptional regulator